MITNGHEKRCCRKRYERKREQKEQRKINLKRRKGNGRKHEKVKKKLR
jgi:hypothetical protein